MGAAMDDKPGPPLPPYIYIYIKKKRRKGT
jgi:hypothetical protein